MRNRQLAVGNAAALIKRGQQIFAYNHLRTNQVVYSLDRSMRNHPALQQQAYAGKQTVPAALRKDDWKPLWTANFSSTQQGLSAFRKLREWKSLHELSWNPKDLPALYLSPQQKADKEKAEEKLREDGGKRAGGARQTRKSEYRRRQQILIMDQRANSVADLAAVLLEQDARGEEWGTKRSTEIQREEKDLVEKIQRLAQKVSEGGLAPLDENIKELEAQVKDIEAAELPQGEDLANYKRSSKLRNKTAELRMKTYDRTRMLISRRIMDDVRQVMAHQRREDRLSEWESLRSRRSDKDTTSATRLPSLYFEDVENETSLITRLATAEIIFNKRGARGALPKKGKKRTVMLREAAKHRPAYSAQGVKISWANPLDAEYAELWPEGVQHDSLGLLRHTALRYGDRPQSELRDKMHVTDDDGEVVASGFSARQISTKMDERQAKIQADIDEATAKANKAARRRNVDQDMTALELELQPEKAARINREAKIDQLEAVRGDIAELVMQEDRLREERRTARYQQMKAEEPERLLKEKREREERKAYLERMQVEYPELWRLGKFKSYNDRYRVGHEIAAEPAPAEQTNENVA